MNRNEVIWRVLRRMDKLEVGNSRGLNIIDIADDARLLFDAAYMSGSPEKFCEQLETLAARCFLVIERECDSIARNPT